MLSANGYIFTFSSSQGKLNLPLQNGLSIDVIGESIEIKGGKLTSCKMSPFTNINSEEIENARFTGVIVLDSGFGDELIVWRTATEKGIVHNVHTPKFNIDERAIEIGMGMMAWLATLEI